MSRELEGKPVDGWYMFRILLPLELLTLISIVFFISVAANASYRTPSVFLATPIVLSVLGFILVTVLLCGLFMLEPNQAAALLLFGAYKGTVRQPGFWWANPFYKKMKVSLRARTLNGEKRKVNDQRGNPIEIAAVVVWKVTDTAQACLDVDNYADYVSTQSETAVRHLASQYAYDTNVDHELSLRGSMDEVSRALRQELQDRLAKAGVTVEEARLSHLAYAPEIAGVMLRRQQAEAVVAARTRIVEGACGMVEITLEHLEKHKTIALDEERKAAMVSNLLVVLCGEQAAQPVVNTGSLYT